MGLISFQFLAFVIIALLCYYLMPDRLKWTVLLFFSMLYYILICKTYFLFMLTTIVTTYVGTRGIDALQTKMSQTVKAHKGEWDKPTRVAYKKKMNHHIKWAMVGTLLVNFGLLGFLKYFTFLTEVIANMVNLSGLHMESVDLGLLLPLGISFYTFQTMGYVIDVYQEKIPVEKNIFKVALFTSFFPQIIQGPIAMYSDLAEQLYAPHKFDIERMKKACLLVLWGMFKKMVIADRAVHMIDLVTGDIGAFSGTFLLGAAVIYALQLYADFSGGIDIVRGIGEMFGITMAENFKRPYFSTSLTEYWHRWHCTLGNWVRNYVFYPLSISKRFLNMGKWMNAHWGKHFGKVIPTSIASLITFLIIGVWHGANGKYVAFGLWNGLVIMIIELLHPVTVKVFEFLHVNVESKIYKGVCILWTFLLVLVGYYFDIAKNFADAMEMMARSVTDFHITEMRGWVDTLSASGLDKADYGVIVVGALVILCASLVQEKKEIEIREWILSRKIVLRWAIIYVAIFTVMIFGYYGPNINPAEFVYMQF